MKKEKVPLTKFGIAVKQNLLITGRTQEWLIEQVRIQSGGFFDSSWLQKIMTGRTVSAPKVALICSILGIGDDESAAFNGEKGTI